MAITFSASATATGTSTTPNITHGLTITSGQCVIAVVHKNAVAGTITDNNGATPFDEGFEINYGSARYAIYKRIAGASEPANYTWTISSSQRWAVILMVFNGVDAAVWDVQPSTTTDATSVDNAAIELPTITVTAGAMGIVAICSDETVDTITAVTDSYASEISTGNMGTSVWRRIWASAGATTQVDGTTSDESINLGGVHFSLKEAAAGGGAGKPWLHYAAQMGA